MRREPAVCAALDATCLDSPRVARTLPLTRPVIVAHEPQVRCPAPGSGARGIQLLGLPFPHSPHRPFRSGGGYSDDGVITNGDAGELERDEHLPARVPIDRLDRAVLGGAPQNTCPRVFRSIAWTVQYSAEPRRRRSASKIQMRRADAIGAECLFSSITATPGESKSSARNGSNRTGEPLGVITRASRSAAMGPATEASRNRPHAAETPARPRLTGMEA
jgi:hypothetical protein